MTSPEAGGRPAVAWPTAGTRLLGVLGHPVSHSLSPVLHNTALAAAGLDLAYVAVDVAPADLPAALAGLGPLGFVGANVTVPHKQAVAAACDHLSDEARVVGAVNTLVLGADGLVGHNTDTAGFLAGLEGDGAGRAVVLGAGGAARAVVVALARRGGEVTVVARRRGQLDELLAAGQHHRWSARGLLLDDPAVAAAVAAADLVVNATPLGLHGEALPSPFMRLGPGQVAYDLVYNPPDTPFLGAATTGGARAVGGLAMLVGQAAAAFELWTGRAPDPAVMRDAARGALGSA